VALEIRILGRVDALVEGQALPLGGSKQRAVLAMLALRANRTVAADELIDGLWGDRPPESAAKMVQLYVHRLRKAFGKDSSEARIVTRGRGYELQLPDDGVDAARFERLVERARAEAERGIADGAARGALELWRGAPLADVAAEPFADSEIRRLEELHFHAIELDIDAKLAAGRHAQVLGRLEALIAEHPLHERFHAQRMLALYRAGRQSEAVEGYRAAHRALAEIGVEPGPELARLQEQILAHDPALDARPPSRELPRQLEGGSPLLAGRDHELRWLRKRWREAEAKSCQVALVFGPPGIGKTRLAAELSADVQPAGAEVFYAAGSGSPEAALGAIRAATESDLATLVVLDDADDASPPVLEAAAGLAATPRDTPLLLLVLHRDEQGSPAFADAVQRLALRPLRVEAAAEIAELYLPADGAAIPPETLMAESDGVPLRVHRAASGWAQAQAAEQLEAAAGKAAVDQGGLRRARARVAGGVADLQAARERTNLYVVAEPPDSTEPEICPFRGLAPFDAAHAEYFFGRERLVADLVARLVGSTLIAVVGPSGSGKSSVIRAGLLPSLADGVLPGSERWRQVLMRPGERPSEELGRALARVGGAAEADGEDPLATALDSLGADERLVLAVDQLEEIFTACRDEDERAAFVEELATLTGEGDGRVLVVVGIRADFYGHCAEHPELGARIGANNVLVGPMRRDELRRAIELPARRAGLRVEPSLVSALVGDVSEEPGGLPLLSTALVELWEERRGRTLRKASYDASGGVDGAVTRLAERAYQRLTAPQRERARAILLRLTDAEQPTPVRRRVPLSELEADRDEHAASALAVLTENRLVTIDEGTVEVAHEALLGEWPRLRAWLEEDIEGRRLHQHLIHAAAEWQGSGRDPAELYRGARLASALDWAVSNDPELNELEREFLEESKEASEREAERQRRTNRRLRTLLAGVGVLLAAAVVAGLFAISEREGARDAATVADAQRLGAEALAEERLDRAALLARAGVALDDSVVTRGNLLAALLRQPPAAIGELGTTDDAQIYAIAVSPDGRLLAHGDAGGVVTLFDATSREPLGRYLIGGSDEPGAGEVQNLAFSPDGRTLAVSGHAPADESARALLDLVDTRTFERRIRVELPQLPAPSDFVLASPVFLPDGRDLLVAQVDIGSPDALGSVLRRVDGETGKIEGGPLQVGRHDGFALLPTADGRRVFVTSERDDKTYEIDAESLRVTGRYPVGDSAGAVSPDGSAFALGSEDGSVRMLDLRSGELRRFTGRHRDGVLRMTFTPDGRKLASSDGDGGVIVWDVARGEVSEELSAHRGSVWGLAVSPDGRTLYSSGDDARAILWDISGERRLLRFFPVDPPFGDFDTPRGIAVSPDGRTLAITHKDGTVELIDTRTLRRQASLEALHGFAAAVAFSPDGRLLAIAGEGGQVTLWHARTLAPAGELRGLRANSQALAFSPDGKLLAAAENEGERPRMRIWNVRRRAPTRFRSETLSASLDFSPDGRLIAAAALERGTEIRDARSARLVERLPAKGVWSRSVAFSPDGTLLAVGEYDGTGRLYSTESWEPVGRPLVGHTQRITYVAFSPDGRTLATASADGTVGLWDAETQKPFGSPLTVAADTFAAAAFSPTDSHLFAVSTRGSGISLDASPGSWSRHACAVAGRGLSPEEWDEVVPERDYISVCPSG
jgi:WD40 repeat protein/DNA-binding SARP family transcriptional activator